MDEEDAEAVGSRLACELYLRILKIADDDNAERSKPSRSAMISEADFYAASYVARQAPRWYPREKLRNRFIEGLKRNFSLLAAVNTGSTGEKEDGFRSEFETLINLREAQYRSVRADLHFSFVRLFLGETFVDKIFLEERIEFALCQHSVSVDDSALKHFVKRVVAEVHNAVGTFPCPRS